MGKSKKIPLTSGLVGRESRSVHGQLEVFLINCNTFHVAIWRNIYSGLLNVVFSIPETPLQEIMNLLSQARKKADTYWLAGEAVKSLGEKGEDEKKLLTRALPV